MSVSGRKLRLPLPILSGLRAKEELLRGGVLLAMHVEQYKVSTRQL